MPNLQWSRSTPHKCPQHGRSPPGAHALAVQRAILRKATIVPFFREVLIVDDDDACATADAPHLHHSLRRICIRSRAEIFGRIWHCESRKSNNDYGDKVGAFNRQGAASGSFISAGSQMSIDSIVVRTPDGGMTAVMLGVGLVGLIGIRRRVAA